MKQRAVDAYAADDTGHAGLTDDASIIGRSLHEPELFTHVYERYAADIHGYIARRLRPEVAEDLLAETFVPAFEKRARFDKARGAARPWLYGIATNVVARHRRTEARRLHALARAAARLEPGGTRELADAVADRLSAAGLRGELMAALDAAIARARAAELLRQPGLPPGLRPAALETLRLIPGLRLDPKGIDMVGRPGVTISLPTGRFPDHRAVFGRRTHTYLGSAMPGDLRGEPFIQPIVLRKWGVTDRLEQVPGRLRSP